MSRALLVVVTVLGAGIACDSDPATAPGPHPSTEAAEVAAPSQPVAAVEGALTLPYTGTASSVGPAFQIKQLGGGLAGRYEIINSTQ
jgi:hypothetical protein